MPCYTRFAIAGASGTVGTHFLREFEHSVHGFDVTILTRREGGNELFAHEWAKKGAKIRPVDYEDETDLVRALSGIEVLISTVGASGFTLQVPLVRAAKKAGVKLYVNSHWGTPLTAEDLPEFAPLDELRTAALRVAEEIDLPWCEFRTGLFPEYCIPIPYAAGWLTRRLSERRATIYGDGNAQASWTTQFDTARYVLHVLRHLPFEELHNRRFNIQGDAKSFNQLVKLYETKHPGSAVEVIYRPLAELEEKVANSEGDDRFWEALMLAIVTGKAKHREETLDNKEYPAWHPRGVAEVL
ncbi:NADP-binding protein [Dacryopinax primogenitus]|uniref:NADP-binding protein n=1 Tax=Dacryopinax primogenitus (strain DJM 731) TaxID=1858805 RepID=M5G686_DACPD|nr:NADP-binding protein [Dacryopinax primogenitus]EJU01347.1 NADP-binding protein [Dacryopinax primogenitus]